MIIDGVRELTRALDAGLEVTEVFACFPYCQAEATKPLMNRLADQDIELLQVSPTVMDRLAFGNRREGIVGIARIPRRSLEELPLPPRPLIVVLEQVEKPGNVGAVIRTADGAGADAVVVCDGKTDLFNPNTIRASLGTVFGKPIVAATIDRVIHWLKHLKARIFVARVDATVDYAQVSYAGSVAIVLGNEAEGLTDAWQGEEVVAVRLPMHGMADSLNVSAAAAVLLYEAQRQR
jgi:TrmH family RNA methyltransferase